MAIKKYVLNPDQQLTEEQILMVKKAAKCPVAADDDNPELTDEQLALFRRVHESRQADRKRQNVTLRLTPQAIQKAKALGKGYSGILSRIVESILDDPFTSQNQDSVRGWRSGAAFEGQSKTDGSILR